MSNEKITCNICKNELDKEHYELYGCYECHNNDKYYEGLKQERDILLTKLMIALSPTDHILSKDTERAFKSFILEGIYERYDNYKIKENMKKYWDGDYNRYE